MNGPVVSGIESGMVFVEARTEIPLAPFISARFQKPKLHPQGIRDFLGERIHGNPCQATEKTQHPSNWNRHQDPLGD
jgi:hypothetical protein